MYRYNSVAYFNVLQQVLHWEEALVEVEYQAKQTASVLFFVLDRNTRNVASMVEAAYLAGRRRKLVIVIDSYTGPGQHINGEAISEQWVHIYILFRYKIARPRRVFIMYWTP